MKTIQSCSYYSIRYRGCIDHLRNFSEKFQRCSVSYVRIRSWCKFKLTSNCFLDLLETFQYKRCSSIDVNRYFYNSYINFIKSANYGGWSYLPINEPRIS